MKIVIDIDEKLYERIKYLEPKADTMLDRLMRSVKNGTPLPKGHGRLIDADALESHDEYDGQGFTKSVYKDDIDSLPSIIKADKESEE